ncbi:MAG: zinc ribbon domain-containing protein [Chloroflexi bacterium]|nr:zinc ribbon domain-containing protein [Chloroflexota bacterium]
MPIYEFFCPKCKKEFEIMRPISRAYEQAKCITCGSNGERLLSVFASKKDYSIGIPNKEAFRGNK